MLTRTPQEIWEAALGDLQVQVSRSNYRTWFSKTTGQSCEGDRFVIGVPNAFVAEYLEKNQRSLIEKVLAGLTSQGVQLVFQVNGHGPRKPEAAPALPAPETSFTRLNPGYTFDAFIEGASNRLARAAALTVTQAPGHSYNPLFIYGGAGLGKTHLLHAIGHATAASHINVICTSAEQFTNEFVTALREKSTEEFRNKYRSIGVLLIDDIQFISGKEQTEESFFHTFNELHNTNRQIVITSDSPPQAIPGLQERLRSRFEWGLTVCLEVPDLATRLAILQAKARQRGASLGQDVLEFIARRAKRNVRELEGALNRVVAFAKLLQATPTPELAARALADIAGREPYPDAITPDFVIRAVAEGFQLSADDLKGRRRDKDAALSRRLAMYLLRQETNHSTVQIGQALGGRDAASVTTACKKIADDLGSNPYLKRKLQDIQRRLYPGQKNRPAR